MIIPIRHFFGNNGENDFTYSNLFAFVRRQGRPQRPHDRNYFSFQPLRPTTASNDFVLAISPTTMNVRPTVFCALLFPIFTTRLSRIRSPAFPHHVVPPPAAMIVPTSLVHVWIKIQEHDECMIQEHENARFYKRGKDARLHTFALNQIWGHNSEPNLGTTYIHSEPNLFQSQLLLTQRPPDQHTNIFVQNICVKCYLRTSILAGSQHQHTCPHEDHQAHNPRNQCSTPVIPGATGAAGRGSLPVSLTAA